MKMLIVVRAACARQVGEPTGAKPQRLRVAGTHTGSHVQLRPFVSDVLDLCGSTAKKHVRQVRQGACHRDLLANFHDVRVARVAARPAMTQQVGVVVYNQACVGACVAFVFPD
jgi:hypothetical protein